MNFITLTCKKTQVKPTCMFTVHVGFRRRACDISRMQITFSLFLLTDIFLFSFHVNSIITFKLITLNACFWMCIFLQELIDSDVFCHTQNDPAVYHAALTSTPPPLSFFQPPMFSLQNHRSSPPPPILHPFIHPEPSVPPALHPSIPPSTFPLFHLTSQTNVMRQQKRKPLTLWPRKWREKKPILNKHSYRYSTPSKLK